MARPSGMHEGEHTEYDRQLRCEGADFRKEMEKAMRLEAGKEYTLYVPRHKSKEIGATAVSKKRMLVGHYQRFARMRSKEGMYESWLYPDLAKALRKPGKGVKVIPERETWVDELGKTGRR